MPVIFIDLTHCDDDHYDNTNTNDRSSYYYKTTKYDLAKDPNYRPTSTTTNEPQRTIVTRARWAIEAKAIAARLALTDP